MKRKMYKPKKEEPVKVNILNTPFLVIVESPSKCQKIEKFLGFQYKCIASKGHIREIAKVGTYKKGYEVEYQLIKEKINHVEWMNHIVKQFKKENVFLATDDDREGEGIAWHICKCCDLDVESTKRIIFHEITQKAVKNAVSNPIITRMNIVKAQQTRQILDRMIGFKISPLLSRLLVHDDSKYLSAGRCQTPTLRLIYDKEISNKKNEENSLKYKVLGHFFSHPTILKGQLDHIFDNETKLLSFIEKAKDFVHVLHIRDKIIKSKKAPVPFSTSQLLQSSSNNLRMSPKYTMECCQTLYQDGKITYMRTESNKLSQNFLQQCKEFIENKYGDYVGDFSKIENKDTNNPHEAIRVTNLLLSKVDYKDKKINDLYSLIWRRSVECCMKDYQYEEHVCTVTAPDENLYKCLVEIPTFLGWKHVTISKEEMTKMREEESRRITYWNRFQGKSITYTRIESSLHMTEIDKYYQESSIIQKLESLGIGRPSTFSMLVETIQDRKYVLKRDIEGTEVIGNEYVLLENREIQKKTLKKIFGASKNKLVVQDLGIKAIQLLLEHFESIFDYSYTSKMESELDELVTNPDKKWEDICKDCEDTINTDLKPLQQKMKIKHQIDEEHYLLFGKSGVMIQHVDPDTKEESIKSLRSDFIVDFPKLEKKEYNISDILQINQESLGIYKNSPVLLKKGPYGLYVSWENKNFSLQKIQKQIQIKEITLGIIIELIESESDNSNKMILRVLNENTSVRKGKYGNYVFFKTKEMSKPNFINIKKCPHNILQDDSEVILQWIETMNLKKKSKK